jgi:8-oxo-dGTP diphosphatase
VANAAAFAVALAAELSANPDTGSPDTDRYAPTRPAARSAGPRTGSQRVEPGSAVTNIASTGSRVGVQVGQVYGDVRVGTEAGTDPDPTWPAQLAALRRRLRQAHRAGELDDATYRAAAVELDVITSFLNGDNTRDGGLEEDRDKGDGTVMVALKRLRGLVADVADLAAKVAAIVTAVRAVS